VGGVYEDIKSPIKRSIYYCFTTARSDAVVANQCFASPTWLVNLKTLKNTDYSGYTERFRNLQARHLNNLSFDRIGSINGC
jgi:hypothetical protein